MNLHFDFMTIHAKDERPLFGRDSKLGLGISLGIGIGAALGVAAGSPMIGTAIGCAVGLGIALIWDLRRHS